MVTNTTLFYNSNIHSKRASYKYLARGTSGGNSETKLAMSNNQGYRPFERVFSVEICNNGKAFPSIRVEDLNYFRDMATEILIGLFVLVYTNTYFFIVGFTNFSSSLDKWEKIVDITCASLMMGAITPETSMVLVCTDKI